MTGRLAIDCRMAGRSGVGTFTENILRELIPMGGEYLLVGRREDLAEWAGNPRVEIQEVDIEPFSWRELFRFPVAKINRCAAFFAPNFNIPGGIRVPIFSTIHDVVFLDVPGLTSRAGVEVRRAFLKRAVRLSRVVFTVSEFSRTRIRYRLGGRKPIVVVDNSIPDNIRRHKPTAGTEESYVLFTGNIKAHKGLSTLVEAWRKARAEGLSHRLVIVGSAEGFRTRDKAAETMRDEGIVFTGRLSGEELARVMAEAEVLVQPSLYEGFGIPPLEALYLGTGAIVSDIEVFKEIYGLLPVTFFKSGDTDDLAKKLLAFNSEKLDVRDRIDELYNSRRSALKIMEYIFK